jgi:hypothetical protein
MAQRLSPSMGRSVSGEERGYSNYGCRAYNGAPPYHNELRRLRVRQPVGLIEDRMAGRLFLDQLQGDDPIAAMAIISGSF